MGLVEKWEGAKAQEQYKVTGQFPKKSLSRSFCRLQIETRYFCNMDQHEYNIVKTLLTREKEIL